MDPSRSLLSIGRSVGRLTGQFVRPSWFVFKKELNTFRSKCLLLFGSVNGFFL